MPQFAGTYSVNDKDLNKSADEERVNRIKKIDEFWKWYRGDHPKPLKVKPTGMDDNVVINLISGAIDRQASMFGIPEFRTSIFTQREPDASGALQEIRSDAQEAVDLILQYNDYEEFITELLLSAFVSGHTFIRLIDNPDSLPSIRLIDPRYVTVFYDVFDHKQPVWYSQQWSIGRKEFRQDIVPAYLVEDAYIRVDNGDSTYSEELADQGWFIIAYERNSRQSRDWIEIARDYWQYSFSPMIQGKTFSEPFSFYGRGDIESVIEMQKSYSFIASNTARLIRFYSHPRTFLMSNADVGDIVETSVDGLFQFKDPSTRVQVESASGDVSSSLEYMNQIRRSLFNQLRVVDTSNKDSLSRTTNFAIRALYSEQLDKTMELRSRLGKLLKDAVEKALVLVGFEGIEVVLKFSDPLPVDRKQLVDQAAIESTLGTTSKQTIAEDLGRDPVIEQERIQEEILFESELQTNQLIALQRVGQ